MFKIALINMPFASLSLPSIGLTQLKSMLAARFGDQISVDIRYINHDFAHYLDLAAYQTIVGSIDHHNSGLGDWFFRQAAFPGMADNAREYFRRYYPQQDQQSQMHKYVIQEKRRGLEGFLNGVIAKYELDKADIVGFTSMFSQNVACFSLARKIKERNPKVITVMGGANCEAPMGQEIARHVKQIDFVFSGPALKSFPEFVRHCMDQELDKCSAITGVIAKTAAEPRQTLVTLGKPAPADAGHGGAMGEELDIDNPVHLDYDSFLSDLDKNFPNKQVSPVILFETSRGCWWGEKAHCTFCGLNGQTMAYRSMKPNLAVDHIKDIFRYSSHSDRYNCVDNIMPKEYVKDVFPYIDTPSNVTLFYEVKADLSEDDMQALSKARVKIIQPGVESLATSTLKLMRKGTNVFQNLTLLRNCILYDIAPEWNLLIGFPGEGDDVYKQYVRDLPSLAHLPPPSGVYPVRFDRYSPYFTQARQFELDLHPVDYYKMTYPFDESVLSNLAYYFMDHNLNAKYFTTMVKWIGKIREKFDVWKARWQNQNNWSYPKLYLKTKDRSQVVYDSRSGRAVEHQMSELDVELLKFLTKPKRLTDIINEFSRVQQFDAEKEMESLHKLGLVFGEGNRYMSLVFLQEPPPISFT
jgi:ribosomal peptide maturation radical SAM protein 1